MAKLLLRRKRFEDAMTEEIQFHFETYVEELVHGGIGRDEAMRRARLEFGSMERVKEECRDARGLLFIDSLTQDFKYSLRSFVDRPGLTLTLVSVIALGIGTNIAISA